MRAVTEPFSPAAIDLAPSEAARVTQRRALDTCAVDRRAIDAALAEAVEAVVGAAGATSEHPVSAISSPAAAAFAHPVWAQLEHLENLLCEWMSGNPACRGAISEMRRHESTPAPRPSPAQTTTAAPPRARTGGDYIAKLTKKLVRRSA